MESLNNAGIHCCNLFSKMFVHPTPYQQPCSFWFSIPFFILTGFSKCDNLSESSKDHCAVEIEPENEDFPTCHSPDIFATDIETPIQFSNVSLVEASKISTASSENICIQTKISKQVEFQSLHWKGKPLSEMCNFFGDSSEFIELQQSICHTILFRVNIYFNFFTDLHH